MYRRLLVIVLTAVVVAGLAGCHNKKVNNPIASINSQQPDKVLFDRSMDAMKHNKFEVARMTLQTLINTYPDSEFVARAKLAVGDSWYAEGGSAGYAQAENEYNDFKTFFPNMPEAAEAQMKIGKIHYDQMEKADRDFTHAKRAEEAYRIMIQEFPDSKLVPEAKAKLRQVQEVLAQREFIIGRFYYVRQSYPAAIARLESLADTYPLFSGADETLYMLGQAYEREIDLIRATKVPEVKKGQMIKELQDKAANAYSRILTRYPISERAVSAKEQLQTMHRPVPTATKEAIEQNKAEEESRGKDSRIAQFWNVFHRGPSVAEASKVGDPTMTDPRQTSAPEFMKHAADVLGGPSGTETKSVTVERVGTDAPAPNQAPPRSDAPATGTPPAASSTSTNQVDQSTAGSSDSSIGELPVTGGQQSNAQAHPDSSQATASSAQPSTGGGDSAPAVAPTQVNDVNSATSANSADSRTQNDKNSSSSKKKKKSGLGKLNPF